MKGFVVDDETARLYRKWSVREGVFGTVGKRWLVTDLWWTDEYHEFGNIYLDDGTSLGLPLRVMYHGTKWCWSVGATHQRWLWREDRWSQRYGHLVFWPRNHRTRWKRAHPHEAEAFDDARKWRQHQQAQAQE